MVLNRYFSYKLWFTKAVALLMAAGILLLTSCNMNEEESAVSILKDGTIDARIVDSFEKSYYNQEELQQKILTEAAGYNRRVGEDAISVEKVAVEDGMVKVKMTYARASDYADFNNGVFFVGSIEEAREAGYDLNKVLVSVKDSLVAVGMSDILAMTDVQILITDMKEPVHLNGKAAYISSNVSVDEKLKSVTFNEESEEMSYVIFAN